VLPKFPVPPHCIWRAALHGLCTLSFLLTEKRYRCRPLDEVVQNDFLRTKTSDQDRRLRSFTRYLGELASQLPGQRYVKPGFLSQLGEQVFSAVFRVEGRSIPALKKN
jgi:hypothetical protein